MINVFHNSQACKSFVLPGYIYLCQRTSHSVSEQAPERTVLAAQFKTKPLIWENKIFEAFNCGLLFFNYIIQYDSDSVIKDYRNLKHAPVKCNNTKSVQYV